MLYCAKYPPSPRFYIHVDSESSTGGKESQRKQVLAISFVKSPLKEKSDVKHGGRKGKRAGTRRGQEKKKKVPGDPNPHTKKKKPKAASGLELG